MSQKNTSEWRPKELFPKPPSIKVGTDKDGNQGGWRDKGAGNGGIKLERGDGNHQEMKGLNWGEEGWQSLGNGGV